MDEELTQEEQGQRAAELERQASEPQGTILGEFVDFLLHNKKWWLTPIVLLLLLFGALLALLGTGAAPFIYAL